MVSRGARRRLSMGLKTVLGLERAGFFMPHRHAAAADRAARRPAAALAPAFAAARPDMEAVITRAQTFGPVLDGWRGARPPAPRFEQSWFPGIDGAVLYALVRQDRPRRIVEVGSGHSTRFIMQAVRDGGFEADVHAVDPAPRADLGGLPLTLHRSLVQDVDPAVFAALSGGDLLLVDSSHVLMPGTDVDLVLNHVLPAMPDGLLVAFHDIFLPEPYPDAWPFTGYNEQNAVACLLQGRYRILFASAFARKQLSGQIAAGPLGRIPVPPGARESLLVLRKG